MAMNSHLLSKLQADGADLQERLETLFKACDRQGGKFTSSQKDEFDKLTAKKLELAKQFNDEKKRIIYEEGLEPLPDGPLDGRYTPKGPKVFESLGHQIQAIVNAQVSPATADPRLFEINHWGNRIQASISGAGTSPLENTGYFIQESFSNEIIRAAQAESVMWQRCRQFPIEETSRSLKIPVMRDRNRASGSRFGGLTLSWTAEGDTISGSNTKFDKWECSLSKLAGLSYLTGELLRSAPILDSVYREAWMEELKWVLDDTILSGSGAGGNFLGVMESDALVTVNAETGQASNTIVAQNIVKMFARFPAGSMRNGVWLVNQNTLPQLFLLSAPVGTAGQLLMLPAAMETGVIGKLMGLPVIPVEQAASLGTTGDIMLCDFSRYGLLTQGLLKIDTSTHLKFDSDQIALRLISFWGGQPIDAGPITPANGSSDTLSPFVALATRS